MRRLFRQTATFTLTWLLAVSSGAGALSPGELVDRILVVVDERPLLLSEVRAVEVIRKLDRAQALEAAIDERLMYQEAAHLPQAEVSDEDLARALDTLLESRPDLSSRVPLSQIRRLLRRQAVILRYVDFRFRPQIRIEEDDLRAAWNREFEGEPQGPAYEEAVPGLRARLERAALDRRIEEWVEDLRGRADVRYVEGPGSSSGPAETPADP